MRPIVRTMLGILAAGAAITVLVFGGLWWWTSRDQTSEWTSRSPEALEELEAGLEDLSRYYFSDAVEHLERALELDPRMPAPKIFLARIVEKLPSERDEAIARVRGIEEDEANRRERVLAEYFLAMVDGETERAGETVDAYLQDRPRDPWVLAARCGRFWQLRRWNEAEACYGRLIDLHPNWVEARGRLGYVAMARGRFDEAEEHFRTYVYIAPQEAAPHAALAQLLVVRGRYGEASRSLDRSLEIKEDFCEAHFVRVPLHLFRGEPGRALEALEEMHRQPACRVYEEFALFCSARGALQYYLGNREAAREIFAGDCLERRGGWDIVAHRMAVVEGDLVRARVQSARVREGMGDPDEDDPEARGYFLEAIALHMEGLQAMAAATTREELRGACDLLEHADAAVQYWTIHRAAFKLNVRHDLLVCLEAAGMDEAASRLRAEVNAVNPTYLDESPLDDVETLVAGIR